MPVRSKADTMPPELKKWLDEELVRRGFSDYRQLAEDLRQRGGDWSKSGVQRYGSKFELRMAQLKMSSEQATALVDVVPDDADKMGQAVVRLAQDKIFQLLVEMDVDPKKVDINKLFKSAAEIGKASVTQKRWQAEVRTKAQERMKAVEAEARSMPGNDRDVALAMLEKVRAVYEGAL